MSDPISREAAIKLILSGKVGYDSLVECPEECNSMLVWAADEVAKMPTIDHVKHGRWIEDGYGNGEIVCSNCGEPCATFSMLKPRDRFCKWCGAKMEGEEDE